MTEPSAYDLETLWEDVEFVLSRGVRDGEPSPLLVVAPVSAQPSPGSFTRLEHAYTLRDELDPAWAARPLRLVRHRGRPMLLLEDPGGEPLARLMGQPWEITSFLRVAIGLAAALSRLHERGLIHKDVKPAHILVNAATGAVWLTGFGIASRLPRERQAPEPPEVIAGTLAYMAPEQTGRMNRSIDSRSDLYAYGVTLYEMLLGVLPFSAADPMEWVHCHIARQPTPPSEQANGIPGPLSAIVMKLLAKTAEERYQTAAGVAADLRRCQVEWETRRHIDLFPLGAHDVSDRLLIPEKLYGREREIDALLAAFDRVVANGTPELVLVSGYSGIGKSSVVNELHKVLVPPRGLFASGKFDQYKRDIPYATLAQAFQSLVRPLLGQSEAELGRWRNALSEALGPNGQLIVNLVPALELVIGKQPSVPDLPPRDAQNRFQMVFRRFLGVFARPEHPLALFLDDLHWLDTATLDLLEHLVTHSEVRHLLLVGAYRDNEVGPAHPLLRTLEAIRKAGAHVQEIVLTPLGLDDVGRLVADALRCEPERVRPLAQLVHEKTGGNPFFAIQFFTALAEEGVLAFDTVAPAWQWNIDRIRARNYTDNVVDLMAGKLKRLSATTQEALKQVACLGNVAEIATLNLVHGESEEAMHAALWEAVHAGLVLHQESAYKFPHDRIQQAAYSLIPEEHRAEVHLRIGHVLRSSLTADGLAEHLFDVANQLNRGAALLSDRDEKAQVATINLRAGRKAKASAAYSSACVYLAAGMALLDESDWG
ncbi:MAG TPA: serine/threonine-protein kinase PknK, partial [Isosphaeraceae bacterium]|nr:serine/threonine-protein kinase PknK [Isosphaeraceae bacterium]